MFRPAGSDAFRDPGRGRRGAYGMLALVLPIAVHLPLVLGRRTLWFNDVTELHVPIRDFFGRAWARGEFPLWCPDLYLGFPLFAEGQAGPLYPLNWALFPFLPAWWAVGASYALHLGIGSLGAWFWLSGFLGPMSALAGGIVFGLSGHLALHHMHLNLVQALAWLPWCLWAAERVFREGRFRDVAILATLLALLALCGHPQTTVNSFGVVGFYALVRALGTGDGEVLGEPRSLLGVLLAMPLAGGLCLVQVLPTLELASGSVRNAGAVAGQMSQHLTPQALAVLAVPSAFGTPGEATNWLHPGGMWRAGIDLHVGLVAVWAAMMAWASRQRRLVAALALSAAVVFLVALGPLMFGVPELFQLPVLRAFRFPDRLNGPLTLLLAALAAAGIEAMLERPPSRRVVVLSMLGVLLALAAVLGATYRRGLASNPVLRAELVRDLAIQVLSLAAAAGILGSGTQTAWKRGLLVLAAGLPLADHALRQVPSTPPSYWDPPSTARAIREDLCPGNPDCSREERLERVVFRSPPAPYLQVGWIRRSLPPDPLAGLAYNLPMLYGLQAVDGILPLRQEAFLSVYKRMADIPGRTLGPLGGRYVVTPRPGDAPARARRLPGTEGVGAWRDPDALPRAFAVHEVEVVPDPEAASRWVAREPRTLRRRALLPFLPPVPLGAPPPGESSSVKVARYRDEEVLLDVRMAADGLVVLLDSYYPGWEALVDDIPAPILQANRLFRAVPVAAGNHRVEFRYRPRAFRMGVAGSLAVLSILAALLALEVLWSSLAGRPPRPFARKMPRLVPGDAEVPRILPWAFAVLGAWVILSVVRFWSAWHHAFQYWAG